MARSETDRSADLLDRSRPRAGRSIGVRYEGADRRADVIHQLLTHLLHGVQDGLGRMLDRVQQRLFREVEVMGSTFLMA